MPSRAGNRCNAIRCGHRARSGEVKSWGRRRYPIQSGRTMRFDTSQQMKLGQQMKLAPRMIQSMEILQLPMLALQERIEQELESNIALELVEPGADGERELADG